MALRFVLFQTDALALASPSGRISKAARSRALQRIRNELFGDLELIGPRQETGRERDLRWAQEFRALADRGMSPRKFRRLAAELEASGEQGGIV